MERVEKITPLVEEQLKTYNETHELVRKATELLEKYREPALVPIEEITSSDIDDARLIAAINYLHKRKNELN